MTEPLPDSQPGALTGLAGGSLSAPAMVPFSTVAVPVAEALAVGAGDAVDDAENAGDTREMFYRRVLNTLLASPDLGVDAMGRQEIETQLATAQPSQLICRDLLARRMINAVQLGRAVARVNRAREIMSFLDIPPEANGLKESLPQKAIALLRQERLIPLSARKDDTTGAVLELHLAGEKSSRDMVLESQLTEFLSPHCKLVWNFALREVCGAFWLAGQAQDVDSGMEAEALMDRIIGTAVDSRASDIHIDPSIKGEPRAIVKYRIDGFIHSKEVITTEQLERLRVRIENLARMPKVNLSHPNKGAFSRAGYDWRVQVQPHAGRMGPVPRIVIRRLKPDVMPLEALGYSNDFIDKIKQAAAAPNGVIFWTGPTGCGKTESIHAAVVSVNPMAKGLSVHTIEDPPEKRVSGYAVQMEVADDDPARTGMQLLKSSLRADPDVVVFGEVRDNEMAKLVFEAANTGHLVFTTLHTNTALDAVVRLIELGVNPFLLSYVRGVASQRLVRRLCVHCRTKQDTADDYTQYIFDRYQVDIRKADLYQANLDGCPSCNFTGYYGRIAAAEWLRPSKEIIEAANNGQFEQLEDMARRAGWQPMGRMGTIHIARGITDAAELSTKILELSSENT